jgi:hypothetical protein
LDGLLYVNARREQQNLVDDRRWPKFTRFLHAISFSQNLSPCGYSFAGKRGRSRSLARRSKDRASAAVVVSNAVPLQAGENGMRVIIVRDNFATALGGRSRNHEPSC